MPTSSFDRRIEITDPEAIKKLAEVIAKEVPKNPYLTIRIPMPKRKEAEKY